MFLTTYVDHHPGSAQYNWFIADMTTNLDRTVTPWVVVVSCSCSSVLSPVNSSTQDLIASHHTDLDLRVSGTGRHCPAERAWNAHSEQV